MHKSRISIDVDHIVRQLPLLRHVGDFVDIAPDNLLAEARAIANEHKPPVPIPPRHQTVMVVRNVLLPDLGEIRNSARLELDVAGGLVQQAFEADAEFGGTFTDADLRFPAICFGTIGEPDMLGCGASMARVGIRPWAFEKAKDPGFRRMPSRLVKRQIDAGRSHRLRPAKPWGRVGSDNLDRRLS